MADEKTLPKTLLAKAQDQNRYRGEKFVSDYANNVSVSISNWDMAIMFGRVKGINEIEETFEIIISKEMAKALTSIMATHLKTYEDKFGEIKIPDIASLETTGQITPATSSKPKPDSSKKK